MISPRLAVQFLDNIQVTGQYGDSLGCKLSIHLIPNSYAWLIRLSLSHSSSFLFLYIISMSSAATILSEMAPPLSLATKQLICDITNVACPSQKQLLQPSAVSRWLYIFALIYEFSVLLGCPQSCGRLAEHYSLYAWRSVWLSFK